MTIFKVSSSLNVLLCLIVFYVFQNEYSYLQPVLHFECLEHNHDKSKNCYFGIFDKWMCCSIILLEHNPAMSSLRHNSLESHSKNHQCKHVWSTNMICPEITMVVRTYQVCALSMLICPFMAIIFRNYIVYG